MPLLCPNNFRWISTGQLAGSARLTDAAQVDWLYGEGVRGVVSTIDLPTEVVAAIRAHAMDHLVIHVPDYGVPTDAQVESYLGFVERLTQSQQAVLVHCAYGVGRTGTLAVLWLLHKGVDAQTALDRVGVESRSQVQFVYRWAERLLEASP
jgi:atypical dual specificity phosphatase